MTATQSIPSSTILDRLVRVHGAAHQDRINRGLKQVASRWTPADGDENACASFCEKHFVANPSDLARLRSRLETAIEQIGGHLYEMRRSLRRWSDLRGDELAGVDDTLAMFDPAPDISEEVYRQKLAFIALLNFPRADLAEMLRDGDSWDVGQWVGVRTAQHFGPRIPKELNDKARAVGHACQKFVSEFHIPVGAVVTATDGRWLPAERKLIAHWLVREEVKGLYGDSSSHALVRQHSLMHVMRHSIEGSIPSTVMDGSNTQDWNTTNNTLGQHPVTESETIGLVRYEKWLEQFRLAREFDLHHPDHPTAMSRKFELAREIPEHHVTALLTTILDHPVRQQLAAMVSERVGRPLESFDVYFEDFGQSRPASEMNAAVTNRFPDEKALEVALPSVLRELGWPSDEADLLGSRILVEIGKGAGHAMRPALTQYNAWLRTSRLPECLGWDGFDTAMHELGHNLEQLCSCLFAPSPALRGVPNTACTEAFAFLYQSLAKRVIGMENEADEQRAFDLDTVNSLHATAQIAGPGLLELQTWHWLYAHPTATARALRDEVLTLADTLWDQYYRRDFGPDPYRLLGAYQHMIAHPLYLPDYALGHIISHQIRSHMRGRALAAETKRITSQGRWTPDLWMRRAVGSGISAQSLCEDAKTSLDRLSKTS